MGRPGLIFEVCTVRGSYRCIVFSSWPLPVSFTSKGILGHAFILRIILDALELEQHLSLK